jgi:hypothetical protein
MEDINLIIKNWKNTLCPEIDAGGLFTRNRVVHKWKAPLRALLLRESVAWRLQELLEQSLILYENSQILGARILLRSAFETIAILVYLNQEIHQVLNGVTNFHDFSDKTSLLLLGSRNNTTDLDSINILTVIKKANKRYPRLEEWYISLCESAHPNYEGTLFGYSTTDADNFVTSFESRWVKLYGDKHPDALLACITVFEAEYNYEWTNAFESLEQWIEDNDSLLEETKPID